MADLISENTAEGPPETEPAFTWEGTKYNDTFIDIAAPEMFSIEMADQLNGEGAVVWIHLNGQTILRASRIKNLLISDKRTRGTE